MIVIVQKQDKDNLRSRGPLLHVYLCWGNRRVGPPGSEDYTNSLIRSPKLTMTISLAALNVNEKGSVVVSWVE